MDLRRASSIVTAASYLQWWVEGRTRRLGPTPWVMLPAPEPRESGGLGSSAPPRPTMAGCTSPGSSSPSARRAREGSGQRAGEGMKAAWSAGEGSGQPRRQCSGGGAPAVQQPCPIRVAGSAGKSGNCPPEPAGDGSGGGSSGSGRTAVLRRKPWSTVRSHHSLPTSCAWAT